MVDVDDEVSKLVSFLFSAGMTARRKERERDDRALLTRDADHLSIRGQGDLGHTDLQDDLEFHNSSFVDTAGRKGTPGATGGLPLPATASRASGASAADGKRFLWSLSFYAQFFDVDTSAVLTRCWAALYPRANFLDVLEGNPDLYGPSWIATTVVFILFLSGTISQYLASTGDEPFAYDFTLLSGMSD